MGMGRSIGRSFWGFACSEWDVGRGAGLRADSVGVWRWVILVFMDWEESWVHLCT